MEKPNLEDSVLENLPAIDPEAGVAREVQVKLYYRLTDEAYLVGVASTVTLPASERIEKAMIRKLLSGVPPLTNNVSEVIPGETKILDVSLEGGILYITLSGEFFDTSILDEAKRENAGYLESGFLTRQEYDVRVAAAEDEAIEVCASDATKCERCWHYRDDVGVDPAHPAICGRCVSNLYGEGEVRRFA